MSFKGIRIKDYKLGFSVDTKKGCMSVDVHINLKNITQEGVNQIPFILHHGFVVEDVGVRDKQHTWRVSETHIGDMVDFKVKLIEIDFNQPIKSEEEVSVNIKYKGELLGYEKVMAYVNDRINDEFFGIRPDCLAYPILADNTERSLGDSYKQEYTYEISIELPKGHAAANPGELIEVKHEGDRSLYRYSMKKNVGRIDATISKYELVQDGDVCIFAFKGEEDFRREHTLKQVKDILSFFEENYGPYGEDDGFKLILTDKRYGGQAGVGYLMVGNHPFDTPAQVGYLFHEIGHKWNVRTTAEIQRTRFYDEAFACYYTVKGLRDTSSEEQSKRALESYRKRFVDAVKDNEINGKTPISQYGEQRIGHNSYTKGPWVMCVAEELMGRDAFNRGITEFLKKYENKNVEDFESFKEILGKYTDEDLDRFFQEWIYGVESTDYLIGGLSLEEMAVKYKASSNK